MKFKRIVCLVADGFGVGEAPDAVAYGDTGSNTLGNLAAAIGGIKLPNLQKLGLGNLGNFEGLSASSPEGFVCRLAEKSHGKDTTTGHWELAGLVTEKAFALFPNGFSKELREAIASEAKILGWLGNKAASGTQIIEEYGEESVRTGKPILYTSGDSVFQIAAHEESFGLQRLYQLCEIARRHTLPIQIGRVIARPFIGSGKGQFRRTEHRRDYSITPPPNCIDALNAAGVDVVSVGKIEDIFDHRGFAQMNHTGNNLDSLEATLGYFDKAKEPTFIFTNLVDFDQLWGHRRDSQGYANSLVELDSFLPRFLAKLQPDDLLLLTSDHGCDPTFKGTDHTREYVPLVAYSPSFKGKHASDRSSFADVGAALLEGFGVPPPAALPKADSFLHDWDRR